VKKPCEGGFEVKETWAEVVEVLWSRRYRLKAGASRSSDWYYLFWGVELRVRKCLSEGDSAS